MGFVIAKGGSPTIFVHSGDLTSNGRVSNPNLQAQTRDATTFADSGVKRKVGLREIAYHFEGLFDSAAQKSHAALNDLRENQRIVSIYPEGTTAGKPGIVLNEAHAENYSPAVAVGDLVPLSADIVQSGAEEEVNSLAAKRTSAISATTDEDGLQETETVDGGVFVVHAFTFTATGGNARWQALLQDSDDDAGTDPYVTVATINISAVGAQRTTYAGTLKAWSRVRWVLDATTGTLLAHAGLKRE